MTRFGCFRSAAGMLERRIGTLQQVAAEMSEIGDR